MMNRVDHNDDDVMRQVMISWHSTQIPVGPPFCSGLGLNNSRPMKTRVGLVCCNINEFI